MKLVQVVLSLLILGIIFHQSEQQGQNSGPYDMTADRIYLCEDQGNNKAKLNISLYLGDKIEGSYVRKHLHRGSLSFPFTEEDVSHMEVEVFIYQKKTNDYLLMYKHHDDFCKTVKEIAEVPYKSLRKAVGLPEEGCVIPTGNYTFNDFDIEVTLPTPMLEYGTYKAIINLIADGEIFGCLVFIIIVKKKY